MATEEVSGDHEYTSDRSSVCSDVPMGCSSDDDAVTAMSCPDDSGVVQGFPVCCRWT